MGLAIGRSFVTVSMEARNNCRGLKKCRGVCCSEVPYVGWGGFQKEGDEWDYGLVLKPGAFGLGMRITRKAIAFAVADRRIPYMTLLLQPSRRNLGGLARLGAKYVGKVEYGGARFLKYRLDTQ